MGVLCRKLTLWQLCNDRMLSMSDVEAGRRNCSMWNYLQQVSVARFTSVL